MITVLTVVCLALGIALAIICGISVYNDPYANHLDRSIQSGMGAALLLLTFIGLFIADMCFVADINTANVYDAQIAIVQEENTELEEQ